MKQILKDQRYDSYLQLKSNAIKTGGEKLQNQSEDWKTIYYTYI